MTKYKNSVCRGSWALGTACGKCERCKETDPSFVNMFFSKTVRPTKGSGIPLTADQVAGLIAEALNGYNHESLGKISVEYFLAPSVDATEITVTFSLGDDGQLNTTDGIGSTLEEVIKICNKEEIEGHVHGVFGGTSSPRFAREILDVIIKREGES